MDLLEDIWASLTWPVVALLLVVAYFACVFMSFLVFDLLLMKLEEIRRKCLGICEKK